MNHLSSARLTFPPGTFIAGGSRNWSPAPSLGEIFLLAVTTYLIFGGGVYLLGDYWEGVSQAGDNRVHAFLSSAIRAGDFSNLPAHCLWGLPLAMAAVGSVLSVSDYTAIIILSFVSSFISLALVRRLWGGWIAAALTVVSWDWISKSTLGGTEPFFVMLLLLAFWCSREGDWGLAAFFAAYSATVSPSGILALLAIATALLGRREFQKLYRVAAVGAAIGLLYWVGTAWALEEPLFKFHSLRVDVWTSRSPIAPPLMAIWQGFWYSPAPATHFIKKAAWGFLILAGGTAMVTRRQYGKYFKTYPVEGLFAALYIIFLLTRNFPADSWERFSLWVIPALPFLFSALEPWIPKDRRIFWAAGILSAAFAAAAV